MYPFTNALLVGRMISSLQLNMSSYGSSMLRRLGNISHSIWRCAASCQPLRRHIIELIAEAASVPVHTEGAHG